MFDEEQLVEAKWNPANKKHYEELGYTYTRFGDIFLAKAIDLPHSSNIIIKAICDYCGKEVMTTMRNYYCDSTKNMTQKFSCGDKFCTAKKIEELYGKKRCDEKLIEFKILCETRGYIPITENYINTHTPMEYICPKHGVQHIALSNLKNGQGCPVCGTERGARTRSFSLDEVKIIVESKNNNILLNANEYVNVSTKNLHVICGSCGQERVVSLSSIINSQGNCLICGAVKNGENKRLSQKKIIEIVESKNDNKLLNPQDYKNITTINMEILCGCCGKHVFVTSIGNYIYNNTNRCQFCSKQISKGELAVKSVLDEFNILYVTQYKFDDCRNIRELKFDFYLYNDNTCIEFDGDMHYKPRFGEETLELTQYRDSIKDKYCKDNNIKLIRIPYWERKNIRDILIKELNLQEQQTA